MLIDFLLEYPKKVSLFIKVKDSACTRQNYRYLLRLTLTYRHCDHIAITALRYRFEIQHNTAESIPTLQQEKCISQRKGSEEYHSHY